MQIPLMISLSFVIMMLATVSYFTWDIAIVSYFHAQESVWWVAFFDNLTILGQAEYSLIPAAGLYLYFKNKSPKIAVKAGYVFLSVVLSGVLVNLVKIIAGRFRPEHYFDTGAYGFDFFHITHDMTSFPSGHATTALGTGMALAILYPRLRGVFLLLAVAIMMSRLVIVRHYPSDIMIGAWLGVMCSYILYVTVFKKRIEDA